MRRPRRYPLHRPTRTKAVLLACACVVLAGVPAAALAAGPAAGETSPADQVISLAPVDSLPDAAAGGGGAPAPGAPGTGTGAGTGEVDPFTGTTEAEEAQRAEDLDGTLAQLRATRTRLESERAVAQAKLLRLTDVRAEAESRRDDAVSALAAHLVDLYDQDEGARLEALIAARDAVDVDERADLIAALDRRDAAIITAIDTATDAVTRAAATADAARSDVLALGTRIDAVDEVIEGKRPLTAREQRRARGESFSFDADYVFATGPIPGIGYWGDTTGGGLLTGWMGYAGAAVGGIGCTAPDPAMRATGNVEQGEASWYGPGFHGQNTANGEVYDQEAMTAAHKTLPFGTIVRVYSSATARCAFVRINDRGPFVNGRIIDLSHAAAQQIGMSGTAPVQIEVWALPGQAAPAPAPAPAP